MLHYVFRKYNHRFLVRISNRIIACVLSAGALIRVVRQGNTSENYEAAVAGDISNSLLMQRWQHVRTESSSEERKRLTRLAHSESRVVLRVGK